MKSIHVLDSFYLFLLVSTTHHKSMLELTFYQNSAIFYGVKEKHEACQCIHVEYRK
jgi:hypothetical protein